MIRRLEKVTELIMHRTIWRIPKVYSILFDEVKIGWLDLCRIILLPKSPDLIIWYELLTLNVNRFEENETGSQFDISCLNFRWEWLLIFPLNYVTKPFWGCSNQRTCAHYNDVIMSTIAFQITSLTIVYSAAYSGADQRWHQSSASLAFVWGIHRWPVNSPHKRPVTRKMFPFDDVIMMKQYKLWMIVYMFTCMLEYLWKCEWKVWVLNQLFC